MGLCGSTEEGDATRQAEKARSKEVDNTLIDEANKNRHINKLLLLGTGESGKSTLFKQMTILYAQGFPERDRKPYASVVYSNLVRSMNVLCINSAKYGPVSEENEKFKNLIMAQSSDNCNVDQKLGEAIKALWQDPGIQETYKNRSKMQLNDSSSYFFGRIDTVMENNYIPDQQDILRTRVPTTGIVESEFKIEDSIFRMFDVGGQRSERKKWIHCFENVTAVLFVTAISEYDQVLYEDETTNRMMESMDLFEEICNSEWFDDTAMILFLNKKDIFQEKIQQFPVQGFFPDFEYDGDAEGLYDAASGFFQNEFESKGQQDIYSHITTAIDSDNILYVFGFVKDIVIKTGLQRAGLT